MQEEEQLDNEPLEEQQLEEEYPEEGVGGRRLSEGPPVTNVDFG